VGDSPLNAGWPERCGALMAVARGLAASLIAHFAAFAERAS